MKKILNEKLIFQTIDLTDKYYIHEYFFPNIQLVMFFYLLFCVKLNRNFILF